MSIKILTKLTVCLLLLLLIWPTAFAQFSMPRTINTPYGKATIPGGGPMRFPAYYGNQGFANKKHKFTIVLLNDSTFEVRAKINIEDSINSIKWSTGGEQHIVLPSETKEIYRSNINGKISGIPQDSCWIFLVKKGKISTYSVSSDIEVPMINYIQKDDGQMVPFNADNIKEMVSENEKALALANKGKLLKAIEKYNSD